MLAAVAFWQQRDDAPRRVRRVLFFLRCLAVVLLALWLLQPISYRSTPHPGGSRIAFLADASASMSARSDCQDIEGGMITRWQAAWLEGERVPEGLSVLRWRFCGADTSTTGWPSNPLAVSPLPGESDLGAVLNALSEEATRPGALPFRSVVLLSDGRDWGDGVLDATKRLSWTGVPISTLCLGEVTIPGDLSVEFLPETPSEIQIQQSADAVIAVKSTFDEERTTTVRLRDAVGAILGLRELQVPAHGEMQCRIPFPISDSAGERFFQAEIDAIAGDGFPENNRAAHLVNYQKPPEYRVLYLADNLDWEWRFLRGVLQNRKDLRLSALIRLGLPDAENDALSGDWKPNVRFYRLDCQGTENQFPSDASFYAEYDCVILPCRTAAAMDVPQQDALKSFVQRRGGGILWIGDGRPVPENLRGLLPGTAFEERQAGISSKAIAATREFLFSDDLFSRPISIVAGSHYVVCRQPSRLARVVLKDDRGNPILMTVGNCGAGRAAWCGLDESWRWAFGADALVHREFWCQLTSWLGENLQPQLEADFPAEGLKANQVNTLAIRVLGPDFRPALASVVSLKVSKLGKDASQTRELMVLPDPQEDGRYVAHYIPDEPGAVQLKFVVSVAPGTEPLVLEKCLEVRATGKELSDVTPNPELLRDITRITGGKILERGFDWSTLPESTEVPQDRVAVPWMPAWVILPIVAILLLAEYAIRRKNGMK